MTSRAPPFSPFWGSSPFRTARKAAGIETRAFHPLPDDAWDGLAGEARSLLALLAGRGPAPYGGRFGRWWPTLPPGESRLLPS